MLESPDMDAPSRPLLGPDEGPPAGSRASGDVAEDRELGPISLEIAPTRMWRFLPLALLAAALVTALPPVVAAMVMPRGGGVFSAILSAMLAVGISLLVASVAAAIWKRSPWSHDVLFAELLVWGWLRRCFAEWRLRRVRSEYESVGKASPGMSIELLERVTKQLQARDPYTHGHSQRVARHAVRIARRMHLPADEVAKIRAAAAIHDVGKLYTPRAILNNPRKLTEREFQIIKRHPVDGANMIGPAGEPDITAMVRHHHERLSGDGYPDGLAGERIPLGARIIAVADTFDAITSARPYRPARSHKRALDILAKDAGTQLDAAAVAAFLHSYQARRAVAWTAFATAAPQRALAWLRASGPSLDLGSVPQALPVVGLAGALALPHGHEPRLALARYPHQPAANAQVQEPRAPASADRSKRARVKPRASGQHMSLRVAHEAPRPTNPRNGPPPPSSRARPVSTATGPAPPPPTTTATQPPPPRPPPTAPEGPVSIPTVTPPTISTPSIPLAPIAVPQTPGVKVPSTETPLSGMQTHL
ncbi:MAG TPA: HD-GYP domain-containing protein [Solirubrobacteraceae bacterium]